MTVTVKVPKTKKTPVVQVKVSNTGQIVSTTPVTVKTTASGPGRFDELLDVDASVEVEGAVPVFDPITGKYKVERLDISEVTGAAGSSVIDGGDF